MEYNETRKGGGEDSHEEIHGIGVLEHDYIYEVDSSTNTDEKGFRVVKPAHSTVPYHC